MNTNITISQHDFAIDDADKEIVLSNLVELRDDVWQTMSKNTRKAYQQDFAQYLAFCRKNGMPAMASDWPYNKGKLQSVSRIYGLRHLSLIHISEPTRPY